VKIGQALYYVFFLQQLSYPIKLYFLRAGGRKELNSRFVLIAIALLIDQNCKLECHTADHRTFPEEFWCEGIYTADNSEAGILAEYFLMLPPRQRLMFGLVPLVVVTNNDNYVVVGQVLKSYCLKQKNCVDPSFSSLLKYSHNR